MTIMQAQDFAYAKWAIDLRLRQQVKDWDVEKAFNGMRLPEEISLQGLWGKWM